MCSFLPRRAAIVEIDLAAAMQGHQNQLGFAMAMAAAPLAGRDVMQPDQALRLERQALAGIAADLEEVDAAAGVGGAGDGDPAAVAGLEDGFGHVNL